MLALVTFMVLINTHGKTQTEQDFAQIAGAGLNFVRIPLPYWAIETRDGEPFLAKTAWKCVLTCPGVSLILTVPQVFSQGYWVGTEVCPTHKPRSPLPSCYPHLLKHPR